MSSQSPFAAIKKLPFVQKIRSQFVNRNKFANEKSLLTGNHRAKSKAQSVVFFTAHKCASVYVAGILRELAVDANMTPIDLDAYFWVNEIPESEVYGNSQRMAEVMKPRGYIYCPFRKFIEIPNLDDFKVLLLLRDPRDILTSLYFSAAYSHSEGKTLAGGSTEWRKEALDQSIDDYVLQQCDLFNQRYQEYCEKLLDRPNVLLTDYETLVTDFNTWFARTLNHLDLPVSPQIVQTIKDRVNFKVEKENVYSHKRQVTPGDHRRKLKPETIEVLNQRLASILDRLGYER